MIPLNQIHVAAPCRQSWDEMDGEEQKRFCQSCRQNVYNISEMTRAEAETLIREKEGRLCVRFYRRTDGTVMTRDCPVGLRALRLRAAAAFSGLVTLLLGGVAAKTSIAGPPATMGAPMVPAATKGSFGASTALMGGLGSKASKVKKNNSVPLATMGKPVAYPQEVMGNPRLPISAPGKSNSSASQLPVLGHASPVTVKQVKSTLASKIKNAKLKGRSKAAHPAKK